MATGSQLKDGPLTKYHHTHERTIDQMDLSILRRLLNDGRASLRQMAQELHVSTTTVATRVSRLEKAGIISGYSAMVNFERLGYDLTAITQILVSKGKLYQMEKEIAKLAGVCAVYDVTGEFDAVVIAKFRNRWELGRFTKGLLNLPFVERTITQIVLETIREDFHALG